MDGIALLIIAAFFVFVAVGEVSKYKTNKAFKQAQEAIKSKIAELEKQLANLRK